MVKKSYLVKKDKELKLEVIKNLNPKLYDKVQAGEMELQDAYVQTMMKMKWIILIQTHRIITEETKEIVLVK